ncbi:unnamed protein product [Didymodactylos carnosus]|uniref:MSP domain-containing protein n=1 Tax=Didymodactylos carnosus TaxID=1234261 RepID=A0A8S2H147_9BILA|nr:unnamed protein product [Didymodactylos carnosus]CAF3588231.1 unnamed protein product [Didymodactylos carnosus]
MIEQRGGSDVGVSMSVNFPTKVLPPRNPILCRGPKTERKFTPSTFLQEMSLDTQQKLYNTREMYIPKIIELSDMSETTTSKLGIDEPLFQPYPSDIVFQNFEPFNTYEVPLLLRNNDKVARAVKVAQTDTLYFKIIAPPNTTHKVAPGVAIVYKIQFIPEEQRDYTHEIIISTEREKFLIPIRAIGSRAILDFPDDVTFQATAVKSINSKVLFVRNVGTREARFMLQANKPYYVSPENGILPVGESMQVTVDFKPTVNGEIKDEMVVIFDTGEKIYVHLYGVSQDINVRLDKKFVSFENTYITMTNQRTIKINNYSDQLVHYQWKQYSTEREEEQQKLKQLHTISNDEINAIQKLNETSASLDHAVLIQRTFLNHRRQLNNETYLFTDQTFHIDPVEGDIWPNSFIEIQILFKPDVVQSYNRTAWLDLTGREQRLPLQICGISDGPKLVASFETLEIGCVFVGSTHMYEVILANKGYIDAHYNIDIIETKFGRCFQFEPSEGVIPVDNYQAIQIIFESDQLGEFKEIIPFQINGNPKPLIIEISGSVIGPTFHFDQPSLKFGLVSYGFQTTIAFHLYNTSLVNMPFHLKIAHEKSKNRTNNRSDTDTDDEVNNNERGEFRIKPSKGTIPPQSDIKVYVDFTPRSIQKYDTVLTVDIVGVGKNIFSLPVTAKSTVPRINLLGELIDLGRCFLNTPYQRHVHLQNSTSLPMRYRFVFPKTDCLLFRTTEAEGIIESNSTKDVLLTITVQRLGDIIEKIEINRVGTQDFSLELQIIATGTGPVLFIEPNELKWGTISVLEEHERKLTLSNESPIPAIFHCEFDKKQPQFRCEPQSGVVEPESMLDLKVIAYLNDTMKLNEELTIHVENSSSQIISLFATGTGAVIVSDINIFPHLDLGSKFIGTPIVQKIQFTNHGRRELSVHFLHELDQTSAFYVRKSRKDLEKEAEKALEHIFRIEPERLEFLPGETKTLIISGCSTKAKLVEENYICLAIIGRTTGRDKVLSLNIKCEFVEPLMSFSKTDLYFRVENDNLSVMKPVEKEVTFSNISVIDLNAHLTVKYPFLLKESNETILHENEQQNEQVQQSDSRLSITSINNLMNNDKNPSMIPHGYVLTKRLKILTGMSYVEHVYFDPNTNTKELTWKIDDKLTFTYDEHSFTNTVNLHGEVHYPNLLIDHQEINFGCILNGTEVTRYISVVNTSPLPVKYLWSFVIEPEKNLTIVPQPQSIIKQQNIDENSVQIQSEPWLKQQESDDNEQTNIMKYATSIPKPEEIFDISPFFGTLQSGEIEKTAIRFYGHPGIIINVRAICQVENGPIYELLLQGQASFMAYKLDTHELDFGNIHFDQTATKTISISNENCTPIDFHFIRPDTANTSSITPTINSMNRSSQLNLSSTGSIISNELMLRDHSKIEIIPESGVCEQYETKTIQIKFKPNIPEQFHHTLYLQIGHFQPDLIHLIGRGMFCRLQLDLPRFIDETNGEQQQLFEQARQQTDSPKSFDLPPAIMIDDMKLDLSENILNSQRSVLSTSVDTRPSETTREEALQSIEVQRQFDILLVQSFVINNELRQSMETTRDEQKLKRKESYKVMTDISLVNNQTSEQIPIEKEESMISLSSHREPETARRFDFSKQITKSRTTFNNHTSRSNFGLNTSLRSSISSLGKQRRNKPELSDYLIDFGYVILGTVREKQFHITNPTHISITFRLDRTYLNKSGFSFDCDHVKNLPSNETILMTVTFDPRGANLGLGNIEYRVPVEVNYGPGFHLRLKANVTMPDLHVSNDTLDFGTVKNGECKIATIQLKNPKEIRCEWITMYPGEDMQERSSKAAIRSYRRSTSSMKNKQIIPRIFELLPSNGILSAKQHANIQIKFTPTEEKNYESRLILRINQSSQRIMIICRGSGLEPNIVIGQTIENQFIPTTSITFNPILPHSQGDEQDIIIKNPCSFPIEIYNLEFDKQFLEEEKVHKSKEKRLKSFPMLEMLMRC